MKNKILSIPINKIEFQSSSTNSSLAKVRIYVMHDKDNCNMSYFDEESLPNAKATLHDIPLLCAIEKDEDGEAVDFKGHEIEYEILDENGQLIIKTIYIEQPVGTISMDNNYKIEEIDGYNWVVIDGYIWKEYCSDAYNLLNDKHKKVSMEIRVKSCYETEDDDYLHISDFEYLGITILGDKHAPAMGDNATISLFTRFQSDTFAFEYNKILNELKKIQKGGIEVNRDEIFAKFSYLKGEKFEALKNNKELSNEQLENQLYELSIEQIKVYMREALRSKTYMGTNWNGDPREYQKYYLCDVLFNSNIAIVEDCEEWYKYFGVPYTVNGDSVTLDYDNAKRYVIGDWREYVDGQAEPIVSGLLEFNKEQIEEIKKSFKVEETEEYKTIEKSLKDIKSDFTDLQSDKSNLETEVNKLKQFKLDIEKQQKEAEINSILNKYSELKSINGYEDIIKDKYSIELSELEKNLKVFAFDNGIVVSTKQTFTKNEGTTEKKYKLDTHKTEDTYTSVWDDVLGSYIKQ